MLALHTSGIPLSCELAEAAANMEVTGPVGFFIIFFVGVCDVEVRDG